MKNQSNQIRSSRIAGKLWMVAMGLFLICMGGFFMWYLWAFFQRSSHMDLWPATPCVITKAAIDDTGLTQRYATKYKMIVAYEYQFEGKHYLGDRYKRLQPESAHLDRVQSKLEPYPIGTETVCFINPENPSQAVLKKDSKAAIYSIWFPGLFALGGLGIIYSALFSGRRKKV